VSPKKMYTQMSETEQWPCLSKSILQFLLQKTFKTGTWSFRFFDAKSNNAIKNVSFWINVTKGDQPLMYDLFYTDSGNFTIKFQPGGTTGQWIVAGDHEGALQGWTSVGNIVNVRAPILSDGGLYHFN